jgi:Tfp pilus assembly protein PilZ
LFYTYKQEQEEAFMPERRKHKRRPVSYYVQVADALTQRSIGHLLDITPKGMMIDSKQPFPIGKDYHLRLEMNADISDTGFIDFIARCIWCNPDSMEPNLFDIGLEIVNISPHDAKIVQLIAEKYGANDRSVLNF